jgi:RND family efflux transporter MFP subunit
MRVVEFIKERKALLVLSALGAGVLGYELHQLRSADLVATAVAKPAQSQRGVLAEGRVSSYPGAEVTLSSELAGKLLKLNVKERDVVKMGDVIGELDVSEQRAALKEALARVRETDSEVKYLKREKTRSQQLFAQNAVPQAELDRRVHESTSSERRRGSLLATAARLETVVNKAKFVAPIDGTVTQRFADAGEMLTAGAPLVTIANLDKRRIEAEVGEFDAGRVRLGALVTIRAEGYDGQTWKGSVEEVPDQVVARQQKPLDPSRPVDTRVLLVKVRLDEPVPLRLGQRVEVEILR